MFLCECKKHCTWFTVLLTVGMLFLNLLSVFLSTAGETKEAEPLSPERYRAVVNTVVESAYDKIQEVGIDPDNYVYAYQAELISAYTPLCGLDFPEEPVAGWEEYFTLRTPMIFLSVTIIGIFSNIYLMEKRTGMGSLLSVCRHGGRKLAFVKLLFTVGLSAALTACFALSPLLILPFTTGLSSPAQMVQAMGSFTLCPYALRIGQFLLLSLLWKMAVILPFSLFVMVLGQWLGGELAAVIPPFVLLVGNYLLSTVSAYSPLFALKPFSFFDLCFGVTAFERYRAVHFFGSPFSLVHSALLLCAVETAGIAVLSLLLPMGRQRRGERQIGAKIVHGRTFSLSLLRWEGSKTLFRRRGLILCAVLLCVKIVLSCVLFLPHPTQTEAIYRDYMEQLAGPFTEDKRAYLFAVGEELQSYRTEYDQALAAYRSNEMEYSTFLSYAKNNDYAKMAEHPYERAIERLSYLDSVLEEGRYDNIEFVYEAGVTRYLNAPFDFSLILLLVALFSDVFAKEEQVGFAAIQRCAKYGRQKTYASKTAFALLASTALYVVFSAVDLAVLTFYYDFDCLHAGMMSVPALSSVGWNVTLWQYLLFCLLAGYVGFLLFALLIVGLSGLTKRILPAALLSIGIAFLPPLLRAFGLTAVRFVDLTALLKPVLLPACLPQGLIYACGAAVLLTLTRRRWVGRSR